MNSNDIRNVLDVFKNKPVDRIKNILKNKHMPFSVLMSQIEGDFNFGTVIRNANNFGAKSVYYYGKRRFDKRSAVGTYNYTDVKYLTSINDILELKTQYNFIGLENNISKSNHYDLRNFEWPNNKLSLIIIGEEKNGISDQLLDLCDYTLEIPNYGSTRSINAGCASSIAMYDFVTKYSK